MGHGTREEVAPTTGSAEADRLGDQFPELYEELCRLAHRLLAGHRPDHALQTTALVHEAYLRLVKHKYFDSVEADYLCYVAAKAMRSVLVDHARYRGTQKRGGTARRVPLDEIVALYEQRAIDLIALDEALEQLALVDPELARIVELRFFGGLSEQATSSVLGVSTRTVRRHWRIAKLRLHRSLGGGAT